MTTQRRDDRLPVKLAVHYRTQGAFLVSYTVNLSKGGIFLESSTPLPVGTQVTLRIDVPGTGAFELVGRVAWIRQRSPDGMPDGMGIQLMPIDESYGEAIDNMVESFLGLTVLVLAGQQERISLYSRYVRSILSCDIVEAGSLADAEVPLGTGPDLLILDIDRAVDMSARTVADLRARTDLEADMPIIFLAADLRARELAREAGAAEVLESPPSFATLQAAVIRTLSRPSVDKSPP
jgi:uncharacterized protein (TIGR02266 family)